MGRSHGWQRALHHKRHRVQFLKDGLELAGETVSRRGAIRGLKASHVCVPTRAQGSVGDRRGSVPEWFRTEGVHSLCRPRASGGDHSGWLCDAWTPAGGAAVARQQRRSLEHRGRTLLRGHGRGAHVRARHAILQPWAGCGSHSPDGSQARDAIVPRHVGRRRRRRLWRGSARRLERARRPSAVHRRHRREHRRSLCALCLPRTRVRRCAAPHLYRDRRRRRLPEAALHGRRGGRRDGRTPRRSATRSPPSSTSA